jgi:hypothetical protein
MLDILKNIYLNETQPMKPKDLVVGIYYEEPSGKVWEYVGITPYTIWRYAFRTPSGKLMEVSKNFLEVMTISHRHKASIEIEEWLNE